ncbi:hypothetical protein J1N35_024206 [Gossypium stocksii]|uniref:Uncharacterized protein n=1 Tax=Gossypium stocksii TaxID=47602 RepID=A0A9D4A4P2_9ROSI|nr:hypothetical protein J1N35_024206 [Gossypium stocksii]
MEVGLIFNYIPLKNCFDSSVLLLHNSPCSLISSLQYTEIPDLSQHERVISATNPNFQEKEISSENSLTSSVGMKRGLPETEEKVTKKRHLSQQQPESKSKKLSLEELIKKKTVPEIVKIFNDRINRLIKKDMETDVESVLGQQWPVRPDVQGIKEKFREIATANSDIKKAKRRLLVAGREFEKLENQRKTPSTTTENADPYMDEVKETLKKQLSSAFPMPNTLDQGFDLSNCFDFGSLPDSDFDLESFLPPDDVKSAFTDLENQLNDKGNNHVEVEHFPGLAEELEKTGWGKTPSSLESIAIRIEKDRGKATELGHNTAQVLVCATVKEMEDFSVQKLDLEILKKWGATLNKAKELGFQVGFADDLLRKNSYAYFFHRTILGRA